MDMRMCVCVRVCLRTTFANCLVSNYAICGYVSSVKLFFLLQIQI